MSYQQLSSATPAVLSERLDRLEADLAAFETPGLVGVHVYTGGFVPAVMTAGTDTVGVANTVWLSEVRVGHNVLLTGISFLIGTVGGVDKAIALLFDSKGNVLANSALAGTTVGTLATFQRLAFVTAFQAGPGLYFVGIQTNGTTARLRTHAAGDHSTGLDNSGGQVFGTPVKTVVPATFTVSQGPIAMLY